MLADRGFARVVDGCVLLHRCLSVFLGFGLLVFRRTSSGHDLLDRALQFRVELFDQDLFETQLRENVDHVIGDITDQLCFSCNRLNQIDRCRHLSIHPLSALLFELASTTVQALERDTLLEVSGASLVVGIHRSQLVLHVLRELQEISEASLGNVEVTRTIGRVDPTQVLRKRSFAGLIIPIGENLRLHHILSALETLRLLLRQECTLLTDKSCRCLQRFLLERLKSNPPRLCMFENRLSGLWVYAFRSDFSGRGNIHCSAHTVRRADLFRRRSGHRTNSRQGCLGLAHDLLDALVIADSAQSIFVGAHSIGDHLVFRFSLRDHVFESVFDFAVNLVELATEVASLFVGLCFGHSRSKCPDRTKPVGNTRHGCADFHAQRAVIHDLRGVEVYSAFETGDVFNISRVSLLVELLEIVPKLLAGIPSRSDGTTNDISRHCDSLLVAFTDFLATLYSPIQERTSSFLGSPEGHCTRLHRTAYRGTRSLNDTTCCDTAQNTRSELTPSAFKPFPAWVDDFGDCAVARDRTSEGLSAFFDSFLPDVGEKTSCTLREGRLFELGHE